MYYLIKYARGGGKAYLNRDGKNWTGEVGEAMSFSDIHLAMRFMKSHFSASEHVHVIKE